MSNKTSTESKIKEAALKVFLQKGFSATTTRDIAEAADINLALVNYYFRTKKKLFDIIMMESLHSFFNLILNIFNNSETTLNEKMTVFVENYIDLLKTDANVPLFVLNEIKNDPQEFISKMDLKEKILKTYFIQQIQIEILADNIPNINPLHLLLNLSSMIVFPFISKPLFSELAGINRVEFNQLMEERKKLIPIWISSMLKKEDHLLN